MQIYTENKAIVELYTTGKTSDKKYNKLPKGAIKGFIKAYNILKREDRIEGLYKHHSLNYEKLRGNLNGFESVRCDKRYRLIFKSIPKENEIIITEIKLIEITNHYDSL